MIIDLPFCGDVRQLIDEAYLVTIDGDNGAGKSLLAADLASYWLDAGYSFVSNIPCVWNDNKDFTGSDLPTLRWRGDKLYTVVFWEEGGTNVRSLATLNDVLVQKRKLGLIFFLPSIELPHEDLLSLVIHPTKINTPFFKLWLYEKAYRHEIIFRPFLQILSPALYGVYKSGAVAARSDFLLSWVVGEVKKLASWEGYEENSLRDLEKPSAGMADISSGYSQLYERGQKVRVSGLRTANPAEKQKKFGSGSR